MMRLFIGSAALLLATALTPVAVQAQTSDRQTDGNNTQPTVVLPTPAIPESQDVEYPGTIRLNVDATDTTRRIMQVTEVIPVAKAGPMVLMYPAWIPGHHSPTGPIERVGGLTISGGGKTIPWLRDPVNVYGFRIDVPQGVSEITVKFQYMSPTVPKEGRIQMTNKMLSLEWEDVSFYPAGYYARRIPIQVTAKYPEGWTAATALSPTVAKGTVNYAVTDYETLIDSPTIAGIHFRRDDLGHNVFLDTLADRPSELEVTPEQILAHKRLVDEAVNLFGSRHFNHYDFLFTISDELGGIGLEHHRSSEDGVDLGYFTDWDDGPGGRNLLPHEFTHSWDGKFRRPEGNWTPEFHHPMQDWGLWVYEGQTQFWGYVLGNRSGLYSKDQTLDAYAAIAANLDNTTGRQWRPLIDTTNDPTIAERRPKPWTSWERSEDYYNEGLLMWLEADGVIRRETNGKKSMDDFAKAFFGMRDGDWGTMTFNRADVVRTLNEVAPYDWEAFLHAHLDVPTQEAPKEGFRLGGYKLVYTDKPNSTVKSYESRSGATYLTYGPGFSVAKDGEIGSVIWGSAAFKAGLKSGMDIVAVNGATYSGDVIKEAIKQAQKDSKPIDLMVKSGDEVRSFPLAYNDGMRYPHLEKTGSGETGLDKLIAPQTYTPKSDADSKKKK